MKLKIWLKNKSGEYGKDFMKINFDSDVNSPLNKILNLHNLKLVVRSVFQEDNKYYPIFFLRLMFVWVIKYCIMEEMMRF